MFWNALTLFRLIAGAVFSDCLGTTKTTPSKFCNSSNKHSCLKHRNELKPKLFTSQCNLFFSTSVTRYTTEGLHQFSCVRFQSCWTRKRTMFVAKYLILKTLISLSVLSLLVNRTWFSRSRSGDFWGRPQCFRGQSVLLVLVIVDFRLEPSAVGNHQRQASSVRREAAMIRSKDECVTIFV